MERISRFLILVKLPEVKQASALDVLQGFNDKLLSIDLPLRLNMTYDQSIEMAAHKRLSKRTSIAVYFCDPHSPWQRGSNENMTDLMRKYLPKGTDLSVYSQEELETIADEIKNRRVSHYRLHGIEGLKPKRSKYSPQFKLQVLSHQEREQLANHKSRRSMTSAIPTKSWSGDACLTKAAWKPSGLWNKSTLA